MSDPIDEATAEAVAAAIGLAIPAADLAETTRTLVHLIRQSEALMALELEPEIELASVFTA